MKFTVITGSIGDKRTKDGQKYEDAVLVPELPDSGNLAKDIRTWCEGCVAVKTAGKLQGTAPIGEDAEFQDIDLPVKSSNGKAYHKTFDDFEDLKAAEKQARAMFEQAMRQRWGAAINVWLAEDYGVDAEKKKKVKGFVVPK